MVVLVEHTERSARFKALALFASVYGIGPTTARMLWARGLRSLEDLERWYGIDPLRARVREDSAASAGHISTKVENEEAGHAVLGGEGEEGSEGLIKVALGFREDLAIKCVSLLRGISARGANRTH